LIQLLEPMPQRLLYRLQPRQIKVTHLRLVRNRQLLIQRASVQSRLAKAFEHPLRQHRIQIANADSLAIQLLQEPLNLPGQERLLDGGL
ncbi:MAG TPA: hypothetical protein VEU96_01360, partial [Bryobacteraceae bacterium]|nr:hypothetical protein [Bryobacteraceae bacterium]